MEVKCTGDKGIKTVGLFTLFSLGLVNMHKPLVPVCIFLIGAAYLIFSILKLKHDKKMNLSVERAWVYIVLGTILTIAGVVLYINAPQPL